MRIDIHAELTPEILAEAGIAYSTKDKVYGAKYLKKRNGQLGRGIFIAALAVAMLVMFFVTKRAEFIVLALVALMIGGTSVYAAMIGNDKMLKKKLAAAGGETRRRRYLITEKKIESIGEDKTLLLRWTDFDRKMETENCIILLGARVVVLPKAAFDERQMHLFTQYVEELYGKKDKKSKK